MKTGGGVLAGGRIALIHLCELDTLKLFLGACFDGSGTSFEGSSRLRLVGRRPGETEMLHIRKAKNLGWGWGTKGRRSERGMEEGGVGIATS